MLELHANGLALSPPVTKKSLAALERAVGALPADLREWFEWHDGQRKPTSFHSDDVFTPLSAAEALSNWKFLNAEGNAPVEKTWLPLFENGGGDYKVYVLGGKREGQLLTYYHDDAHRPPVAKSLGEHVRKLARRVVADAKANAKIVKFKLGEMPVRWKPVSYAVAKKRLGSGVEAPVGSVFRSNVSGLPGYCAITVKVKPGAGWAGELGHKKLVFGMLRASLAKGYKGYSRDGELFSDPRSFYPGLQESLIVVE